MFLKKVFSILMISAVLMVFALAAHAGLSLWFADASGNDAGQTKDVVTGQTFTIYIYGTATDNSSLGLAVGFDRTNGSVGISATAIDKKITLATGVVNADVVWSADMLNLYSDNFASPKTAGLRVTTQKNWGVFMARDNNGINTPFNNILVATLNLKNNMAAGDHYNIEIVKGALTNSSYCSFINTGSSNFPGASDIITINSIPETYLDEMILIPAGSFLMGNNGSEPYSYTDELPQHTVNLSEYSIRKYEVTRGEYKQFKDAGGYSNSSYWSTDGWNWKVNNSRTEPAYWADEQTWIPGQTFTQTDNYPVVGVSYYEAEAFCKWAGGHLPTEAQWEKASRWDPTENYPNIFPWGDIWDPQKCNNYYDSLYTGAQTAPVGRYSGHSSPSGCEDMSGNVREWCQDWYKSYPESSTPFDFTNTYRALRGGSWYGLDFGGFLEFNEGDSYRCAGRSSSSYPDGYYNYVGFRVVKDSSVTGISLNKTTLSINKNTSETLVASVFPADAANKNITWASNNIAVATVSSSGLVTAVGGGICGITATTDEGAYVAWCIVTVPYISVTGINFNKAVTTINIGNSETLNVTVNPTDAANKNFTLASTNNAVATVNSSGLVNAVGGGICAITATTVEGGYVAWCVVTVPTIAVTGIYFNKSSLLLNKDAAETLTATISPSNATNKAITWASSNTAVATVNSSGIVTSVGGGICAITATTVEGEYVAWCVVTVPTIAVTGISFNKSAATLNIGNSETLIATVNPSDAANKAITWSSYNTAVATVNSSGHVAAVGSGICAITATTVDGEYVAWCVVTVLE